MPDALVTIEKSPLGFAVLTLNRPDALNALSSALRRELCAAIDGCTASGDVRVLILTGKGRAFSAGLDLKDWKESDGVAGGAFDTDPVRSMMRFPGPIIGAINGLTITGGLEIALACDVLIASSDARFADTHIRAGLLPGWGLSVRLARAIGAGRAKELSLTGKFLSAERAEAWGLVNCVVPPDELLSHARLLAEEMCAGDPEGLLAYKKLIDDGIALPLTDALEAERALALEANAKVSADDIEARLAKLRARAKPGPRQDEKIWHDMRFACPADAQLVNNSFTASKLGHMAYVKLVQPAGGVTSYAYFLLAVTERSRHLPKTEVHWPAAAPSSGAC